MRREREEQGEAEARETQAPAPVAAVPVPAGLQGLARADAGTRARGIAALQAGGGNARVSRMIAEAATDAPTLEEAEATVLAIVHIINEWHEIKDGTAIRRTQPDDHPEVPARYRDLLTDWYLVTHGSLEVAPGLTRLARGEQLPMMIERRLKDTLPLLEVLRASGYERRNAWIARHFDAALTKFRERAIREEAQDKINAAAEAAGASTSFQEMNEDELLKMASSKALETVRLATTLVTRYTNGAAVGAAEKLDGAFKEAVNNASGPPGIEAIKKAATAQLGLMHLKGMLDFVNAMANVSDPAKRAQLVNQRSDWFGVVATEANVLQLLTQFVSGSTAILSATAYGLALLQNDAKLAALVATKAAPVLDRLNIALNFIGVVHGILVLCDENATDEQKENAVLEVGVSGAGVIGFAARLRQISGVGGPLTVSVVLSYFSVSAIMRQGGEMTRSMIKIGLGMCFKDMARTGRELSETAFRFAAALELAEAETDPARKAEYLKQAQGLRWSLRDYYIKDYLRRATQATGNDNQDPGAYPALRDRFRELKDLPLETDEELVDAAGRLLRTMSEVLTQPEKILEEAVHDAFSRRQSVDLPLPDDAPPEDEGDTTTG